MAQTVVPTNDALAPSPSASSVTPSASIVEPMTPASVAPSLQGSNTSEPMPVGPPSAGLPPGSTAPSEALDPVAPEPSQVGPLISGPTDAGGPAVVAPPTPTTTLSDSSAAIPPSNVDAGTPEADPTTTQPEAGSPDPVDDTTSVEQEPNTDCPHSGNVTYQLNGAESWPPDVVDLLTAAMDEAVFYYNCYSDLSHSLTVNYKESVPTAEANVDGWTSFGSSRSYMQVATAMHEIGHTMGVGYSPWTELMDNGRWTGAATVALMSSIPASERDSDMYSQRDYITGDSQHFWPYGLNQASEHQSEWSLINHVRIVAAMNQDKQAYRNGN